MIATPAFLRTLVLPFVTPRTNYPVALRHAVHSISQRIGAFHHDAPSQYSGGINDKSNDEGSMRSAARTKAASFGEAMICSDVVEELELISSSDLLCRNLMCEFVSPAPAPQSMTIPFHIFC